MTETATLEQLNKLLEGEISANETYAKAIEKMDDQSIKSILQQNYECHSARVQELTEAVKKLNGTPAKGSGVWGALANLLESGATLLGGKAMIAVLEEGEDKGVADYKAMIEKVGSSSFMSDLLAKQEQTHRRCADLKKSLA
jgi:uncharacterized protein (TIGR02284 family)